VPGLQSTQFRCPARVGVRGTGHSEYTRSDRYNDFSPRLGIAYSPGFKDGIAAKIFGGPGKSSIRASRHLLHVDRNLTCSTRLRCSLWTVLGIAEPLNFDQPFQEVANGMSEIPALPLCVRSRVSPANKTLDYSIYLPISFSPGYDIHNRRPMRNTTICPFAGAG